MSHKVHPYAHRLAISRDWRSRWFARGATFRSWLKADVLLREYLAKKLRGNSVDAVEIERRGNSMRLIVKTSRPGLLIGRSGEGSTKLRSEVLKFLQKNGVPAPADFRLDIEEVKQPESHAAITAQSIAEGLEKRLPFKRVIKQSLDKILANRQVEGARITISGRLGGAEMGRVETVKRGRLPLQTLTADVDFSREQAYLPYGVIGVKVWIARRPAES